MALYPIFERLAPTPPPPPPPEDTSVVGQIKALFTSKAPVAPPPAEKTLYEATVGRVVEMFDSEESEEEVSESAEELPVKKEKNLVERAVNGVVEWVGGKKSSEDSAPVIPEVPAPAPAPQAPAPAPQDQAPVEQPPEEKTLYQWIFGSEEASSEEESAEEVQPPVYGPAPAPQDPAPVQGERDIAPVVVPADEDLSRLLEKETGKSLNFWLTLIAVGLVGIPLIAFGTTALLSIAHKIPLNALGSMGNVAAGFFVAGGTVMVLAGGGAGIILAIAYHDKKKGEELQKSFEKNDIVELDKSIRLLPEHLQPHVTDAMRNSVGSYKRITNENNTTTLLIVYRRRVEYFNYYSGARAQERIEEYKIEYPDAQDFTQRAE